jgi:Flp pilus assembly protein TadG
MPELAIPRYEVTPNAISETSTERGYILIATSFSLAFLLGVAGLAVDIGRMYIAKNEAQAYVDSASLAAVQQLDGTSAGIARANSAVSSDNSKWRFDTLPFSSVTVGYGTSSSGPFTTSPPNPPSNYQYVQVVAAVSVPMYLIRILTGPSSTVAAAAVAGDTPITSLPSGVFPFSPYTRTWLGIQNGGVAQPDDASDPYGYKVGNDYTLRWGAPGNRTTCGSDATHNNLSQNGSIRGYCCVRNSAASLRQAIVGGQTDSETIGQNVNMDMGAKNTEMSAIADRVNIDTDTTSATYADYQTNRTGNGARVVVVAVNGGAPNYINLGFAGFFLLPSSYYAGLKGNDSACAEYLGAWTEGQAFPAAGGSGGYHLRLLK